MVKPKKTATELRATANRRVKRWQEKQRAAGKRPVNVMIDQGAVDLIDQEQQTTGDTMSEVVERAIVQTYGSTEPEPVAQPVSSPEGELTPGKPDSFEQILLTIADEPGTWRDKASRLNVQGVLSKQGKPWTNASLPIAIKRIRDKYEGGQS